MSYPGELDNALADWLARNGRGGLADKAAQLSAAYHAGANSGAVDVSAYVVARMPSTFATNVFVHEALMQALPNLSLRTLLDIGTGPGTASWAAVAHWPSLQSVIQCERELAFVKLAAELNEASGFEVLQHAALLRSPENAVPLDVKADLVVVSYMLAELPLRDMPEVAMRLWQRTEQVLILIEPGTPLGFARLRGIRETLLGQGAFVVAPCTHQNDCPMVNGNWCHFRVRVQRSREHMHAKQATVPFEDEAFSYLVLSRQPVIQSGGRIVAPVSINKVAANLPLCDATGLNTVAVASRDKPAYKRAKKKVWGDVWE